MSITTPTRDTGGRAARAFAARRHGAFIDGRVFELPGDERLAVENPATEEPLAEVPAASPAAVAGAARAFAACRRESGRAISCAPRGPRAASAPARCGSTPTAASVPRCRSAASASQGSAASSGAHALTAYTELKSVFLAA